MSTEKEAVSAVTNQVMNSPWGEIAPPAAATQDEKLWGMLANLTSLVLIGPLAIFLMKGAESKFVKFNALQMLIVQAIWIALTMVMQVLVFTLVATLPFLATMLIPVFSLLGLVMLIALVILSMKAYNGVLFRLPGIGQFAYSKVYGA